MTTLASIPTAPVQTSPAARIVNAAQHNVSKGRDAWAMYEQGKRQLQAANLSPADYEDGIAQLTQALGL